MFSRCPSVRRPLASATETNFHCFFVPSHRTSHNNAKIKFVKEFGWRVVATFSQSENEYLLPVNHLVTDLERMNISCISTVTFSSDNYKEQLRVLKHMGLIVSRPVMNSMHLIVYYNSLCHVAGILKCTNTKLILFYSNNPVLNCSGSQTSEGEFYFTHIMWLQNMVWL
ncbi:hypothetical protein NQ318_017061 [Aromia moschata]|uniref:Receptor ligand binding region domain-containing protein n=1 Tax=Aromia moschata TaxID=1265417 RepID=A0AAV8XCG0_9CUCU|nr:hypothetical protein NQ318_017061 [Aromia moschata]